jgi:hypothetical protein
VRGAFASGVAWAPRFADHLTLQDAYIAENGTGVVATGGSLSLDSARLERNSGRGVEIVSAGTTVWNSRIVRNGDTGLVFRETNASVIGTTVWGNGASTEWVGGLSGMTRRAGGIVFAVRQPPYQASLSANRIYGNSGDQLLFVGPSSSAWTVGAKDIGACSYANSFGCYDPTPAPVSYRGIVALDVDLAEYSQLWDRDPLENVARLPSGSVMRWSDCHWDGPPLDCNSEDPPQQ